MSSSKRRKSLFNPQKVKDKLTPDQLVIGICLLLLFGLVCFTSGMLVSRVDSFLQSREARRKEATQENAPERTVPAPPAEPGAPPSALGKGKQISPRQDAPATRLAASPQAQDPRQEGLKEDIPIDLPRVPELPPQTQTPDKPAKAAPSQEKAVAPGARKGYVRPKPEPSKRAEDTSRDRGHERPTTAKVSGSTIAAPPTPPKAPKAPERPQAPNAITPKKPAFAIQVAAFKTHNRAKAEQYKQRLEANSDLKVQVVLYEDNKWVRVLLGDYPDRKSAENARAQLKKRPGFADCWVPL